MIAARRQMLRACYAWTGVLYGFWNALAAIIVRTNGGG